MFCRFRLIFAFFLLALFVTSQAHSQDNASEYAMEEIVDADNCIYEETTRAPILIGGTRSASVVVEDVDLLSQPPYTDDTFPLAIIRIPKNSYVVVYDIDEQTGLYYRIVFPCEGVNMTGWVPISTVRFPERRANPKPAPPGCAQAREVVELLDSEWVSDYEGHVAVVADLFRVEDHLRTRFPRSSYYITRNGREIRDRERAFETSGIILIRGSVLSTDINAGNSLGFSVITSSNESIQFFGILYRVPEGCEFGE